MFKPTALKRLAILYSRMSGYAAACQRALKGRYGVDLLCYHWPVNNEAPFDDELFKHITYRYPKTRESCAELEATVFDFAPEAILISGWTDRDYLRVARSARSKGILVIANMDAQWRGDLRQRVMHLAARRYLRSAIDVLWVPGERQRQYAARLGYTGDRVWSGMYACDWDRFAADRRQTSSNRQRYFLFVGRYVEAKGIDVLVEAYRRYRARTDDPWPLVCVGTGDQDQLLRDVPGVTDRGFLQPHDLPQLMRSAGAFVLPSRWEPWGVVVQEAAAAGLPLICSDACGAAVHLLQDTYNGYLFEAEDAEHLCRQLVRMSTNEEEELERMGERSFELSKQFTPARWGDVISEGVTYMLANANMAGSQRPIPVES